MFGKKNQRKYCPLLKKPCIGSDCMWAVKLRGSNPNDGKEIDEESCAMAWMPLLMVENTKANFETGAAVESARNEAVKAHQETLAVAMAAANMIDSTPQGRLKNG